jgi:hypothetical protein
MKRAISPVFFVLAAACFFFPFFSISCQGAEQFENIPGAQTQSDFPEVTGYETLTGAAEDEFTDPEGAAAQSLAGEAPQIDMGPTQLLTIVAAALALIGVVVAFARGRLGGTLAIAAGILGAVALFAANLVFGGAVDDFNNALGSFFQQQGGELGEIGPLAGLISIQAETEFGLWLSVLFFLLAAAWGVVSLLIGDRTTGAAPVRTGADSGFGAPATPPPTAPPPSTPPPTTPPPDRPGDQRP